MQYFHLFMNETCMLPPGKPGLVSFRLDSQSPIISILSILLGQAKTLHIHLDTIPPSLPWTSPLPGSLKFHLHTSLEPVCIILTLNMSKPPQSTPLNCQADLSVVRFKIGKNWRTESLSMWHFQNCRSPTSSSIVTDMKQATWQWL